MLNSFWKAISLCNDGLVGSPLPSGNNVGKANVAKKGRFWQRWAKNEFFGILCETNNCISFLSSFFLRPLRILFTWILDGSLSLFLLWVKTLQKVIFLIAEVLVDRILKAWQGVCVLLRTLEMVSFWLTANLMLLSCVLFSVYLQLNWFQNSVGSMATEHHDLLVRLFCYRYGPVGSKATKQHYLVYWFCDRYELFGSMATKQQYSVYFCDHNGAFG